MAQNNTDPLAAARWALSEAVGDPAAAPVALEAIGHAIGAERAMAFVPVVDASQGFAVEAVDWDAPFFEDAQVFARNHGELDPWSAGGVRTRAYERRWTTTGEILATEAEWRRSPWLSFHRSRGVDHLAALVEPSDANEAPPMVASFYRNLRQGPFNGAALARLEALRRELTQAVALRFTLDRTGALHALSQAALEALPEAAFLASPKGALIWANAKGIALLNPPGSLSLRKGLLSAGMHASKLEHAFAACAAGHTRVIALQTHLGAPLTIRLVCVQQAGATAILVLVRQPTLTGAQASARLREVFGLSATEAEVALALSDNKTPRAIAHHRGVSIETVRSQIKSMLAKLGCTRQLEAVRLIEEALR